MGRYNSKNKGATRCSVVHPNASAIDVGATMHMAAVNAHHTPGPVRCFGTFTTDLHRLVDWFAECGSTRSSWSRPVSIGSRSLSSSTLVALRCSA
jgi:hypothetical protein